MINWKARLKNKTFWVAMIPAVLLLTQQVLALFGLRFNPDTLNTQLVGLVGTIFAILSLLGIVADPTTPGLYDCPSGEKKESC